MNYFRFYHLLVLFALLILLSCSHVNEPTQADKDAITNIITVQFKQAWDINDEVAMASMFLENADMVFPTSPWIKGRDAIQRAFNWDQPEGLTGTFNIKDLRFLDGSTALVNVDAHFSGGVDNKGNPIPDNWDSATSIMKKEKGNWKYAGLRVMPARMDYLEVKAQLEDTWDTFINHWEAGDAAGAASCFTPDAINMVNGAESNVGRAEIKNLLEQFASANTIKNAKATTRELDIIGPKAFEYGIYEDTIEPLNGQPFNRRIRYYAVWKMEVDGKWRWHRFILNELPS
jgi:uncharacterized protein (TIGR02246 family)